MTGVLLLVCGALAAGQEPASQQQGGQETVLAGPPGLRSSPPQAAGQGTRVRIGGTVAAGNIINKVNPAYPPLARQTRISGTVRLHAIIGKEGSVLQLEVMSGHPLLVQSALDAVRQWKYKPTLLNGEAVEVDTTIDVIFAFNEDPKQSARKAIDPVLREDVLQLLELTGGMKSAETVMRKMFAGMRPMMLKQFEGLQDRERIVSSYEDKLVALVQGEEFREGTVAVYAKYFTDEDVRNLLAFYKTPTGKKFNEALPQFSADAVEMGQSLFLAKLPELMKELCKEYPELGGKLPECAMSDPDKKSELLTPREPQG